MIKQKRLQMHKERKKQTGSESSTPIEHNHGNQKQQTIQSKEEKTAARMGR